MQLTFAVQFFQTCYELKCVIFHSPHVLAGKPFLFHSRVKVAIAEGHNDPEHLLHLLLGEHRTLNRRR